jgi:DNA-binding NarL/FixJ family response regulator
VKLLLVDSSEVFRLGLRALLAGPHGDGIEIIGDCGDAATACQLAAAHAPDLVVTDLHLRDQNGVMLTRELRKVHPTVRVLILALQAPEAVVHQALAAGAGGYLLKWQTPVDIRDGIRMVGGGASVLPRGFRGGAITRAGRRARPPLTIERLSHREREIFDLVVWGNSNKQIAERLAISIKTVETHRGHINGKLRIRTSADIVRLASIWGVIGGSNGGQARAAN